MTVTSPLWEIEMTEIGKTVLQALSAAFSVLTNFIFKNTFCFRALSGMQQTLRSCKKTS